MTSRPSWQRLGKINDCPHFVRIVAYNTLIGYYFDKASIFGNIPKFYDYPDFVRKAVFCDLKDRNFDRTGRIGDIA